MYATLNLLNIDTLNINKLIDLCQQIGDNSNTQLTIILT